MFFSSHLTSSSSSLKPNPLGKNKIEYFGGRNVYVWLVLSHSLSEKKTALLNLSSSSIIILYLFYFASIQFRFYLSTTLNAEKRNKTAKISCLFVCVYVFLCISKGESSELNSEQEEGPEYRWTCCCCNDRNSIEFNQGKKYNWAEV